MFHSKTTQVCKTEKGCYCFSFKPIILWSVIMLTFASTNQTPPEIFKNKPAKLFELMILILFLLAHFWDWEMFWVLKIIGQFWSL